MAKIFLVSATVLGIFLQLSSSRIIVNNHPAKGMVVVELFTSEGCSSCPPSDEVISKLLAKKKENVYILSYHVDYWDRLGWKDPFSNPIYSRRQNQYASAFQSNSVYTPQVIVNGTVEFVGSDEAKLTDAVERKSITEPAVTISIAAERSGNTAGITYTVEGGAPKTQLLNIALVQSAATTSVKRGENANRVLHHVNIVRALETVDATAKGSVSIEIPVELRDIPLQIIAFTQDKKTFQISGATQKTL